MNIRNEIESWFPNIIGKEYKVFEVEGDFNCVSFSLDITDGWMWTSTELWPYKTIPRNSGLEGFKKLYKIYGYQECNNADFEIGYDKIAFYSKEGNPTHVAKQFGKKWRSKLGPSAIIEHDLEWISGMTEDAYGSVSFIMKRKKIQ